MTMTANKSDDRPKVIALGAAVVTVFGVGGANVLRMTGAFHGGHKGDGASVAASDAAPPSLAAPAVAEGTMAPPAAPAPAPAVVAPTLSRQREMPETGRDPFRPVTPAATGAAGTLTARAPSPAGSAAPVAAGQDRPAPSLAGPAPLLPPSSPVRRSGRPFLFGTGPAPVNVSAVALPSMRDASAVAEVTMELVGVVVGNGAVAMIRATGDQHFVGVGELIAGYRVVRIEPDVVTLRRGGRERVLRIAGGENGAVGPALSAAAPAPAPTRAAPEASPVPEATPAVALSLHAAVSPPPPVRTQVAATPAPQVTLADPAPAPALLPEGGPQPPAGEDPAVEAPVPPAPATDDAHG